MSVSISQTLAPEKPETGMSLGDASDGVAAIAGTLAALFALLSLRQVQALSRLSETRDARLATLNLLTSGERSLGHLSKPLEAAIAERSDLVVGGLLPLGTRAVVLEAARSNVAAGDFFALGITFDRSTLRLLADWKDTLSDSRKGEIATYLNRLEEMCTSVLRTTLDLRTVDKMYGTLIRESYREAAQSNYFYRRTGSYRYFDQLEHVVDRLTASELQLFRLPGRTRRLFLSLLPDWRRLLRELKRHASQELIDGTQLEAALLATGLMAREDAFRCSLGWRRADATFRETRAGWRWPWSGSSAPSDPTHEVVDADGVRLAGIVETALGVGSGTVTLAGATMNLDRTLAAVPREFFHPEHLAKRTANGSFAGARAIYVCRLEAPAYRDRDLLRAVLRCFKRELNTARLRPFVLVVSATEAEVASVQTLVHSEGGMLLIVRRSSAQTGVAWLF